MCDAVETNTANLVQASLSRELTEVNAMKNFHQLATICDHVNRILTPQNQTNSEPIANSDIKPDVVSQTEVLEPEPNFVIPQDESKSRGNGV